ncbi:MAG: hypothetical protein ACRC06_12425 [Waterburya sp.]
MNEITKAEMRKRLGNITKLQEILFGEQVEAYNQKFKQYNHRLNQLENSQHKFQLVMEERFQQLETKLLHQINSLGNSLEKKIKYLDLTTKEEHQKIQQELDIVSQHNYDNIDFLQNSLNAHASSLKTEITQSKTALDRDLQLLKQQVFSQLDSNLSELSTAKVSRRDLSEILFELCLKLKESGDDITVTENQDQQQLKAQTNQDHVDLMLPEKKPIASEQLPK